MAAIDASQYEEIIIESIDGSKTVDIRLGVVGIDYFEDLFSPTITIERLKTVHPSRPGNRLIAKTFYLMGVFENWGGGTLKIISDTVKAGKPSPKFSYEDGMFRLELQRGKNYEYE